MTDIEEKIFNDILVIIKDNLQLLINNRTSSLYYYFDYCNNHKSIDLPVNQEVITKLTEESLFALLNANFLYDFREKLES